MAVDALFRSCHFYDCVDVEYLLSLDVAIDGHCPGTSLEIFCEVGWAVFLGGEFVEIVVGRDVLVGRLLFRGAERAFLEAVNFRIGAGGERRSDDIAQGDAGEGGRSGDGCSGEKVAAGSGGGIVGTFLRPKYSPV